MCVLDNALLLLASRLQSFYLPKKYSMLPKIEFRNHSINEKFMTKKERKETQLLIHMYFHFSFYKWPKKGDQNHDKNENKRKPHLLSQNVLSL